MGLAWAHSIIVTATATSTSPSIAAEAPPPTAQTKSSLVIKAAGQREIQNRNNKATGVKSWKQQHNGLKNKILDRFNKNKKQKEN